MTRTYMHNQRAPAKSRRSGFTLIELMLVITIIGIMAGLSIGVTRQVYHTARVSKTEATITKIDMALLSMYADYENRRVPSPNFGSNNNVQAQVTQAARLWFLRDMIRMEMPTNVVEATADPVRFKFKYGTGANDVTGNWVACDVSPLQQLYVKALSNCNGDYESAKCLYLVIMYGNPEFREMFSDNEITTDEDGLSYFIDGWGNPIYFLRWAPGLTTSERQPNVLLPTQNETNWDNITDEDKNDAATRRADPLDPTEVGGVVESWNNGQWVIDLTKEWKWKDADNNDVAAPVRGWTLLPVVLSSGGIWEATDEETFGMKLIPEKDKDIPVVDPFYWAIGAPLVNESNTNVIHSHSTRR